MPLYPIGFTKLRKFTSQGAREATSNTVIQVVATARCLTSSELSSRTSGGIMAHSTVLVPTQRFSGNVSSLTTGQRPCRFKTPFGGSVQLLFGMKQLTGIYWIR